MDLWSNLPEDMQLYIVSCIPTCVDYIRYSAVCTSWRRAAMLQASRPPLLLHVRSIYTQGKLNFLNPFDKTTLCIDWPEAHGQSCCGTSHGFLALADGNHHLLLFNPLTRAEIQLPPLTSALPFVTDQATRYRPERIAFRLLDGRKRSWKPTIDWQVYKIVTSGSGQNSSVMALFRTRESGCCLALWMPGEQSWRSVEFGVYIYDIAYCNKRFYSLDGFGRLIAYDVGTACKERTIVETVPRLSNRTILIESCGELLMVILDDQQPKFDIYKLDSREQKLFPLQSLGYRALFLASKVESILFSCSANSFPGLKENCICLIDHHRGNSKSYTFGTTGDNVKIWLLNHDDCMWFTPSFFN